MPRESVGRWNKTSHGVLIVLLLLSVTLVTYSVSRHRRPTHYPIVLLRHATQAPTLTYFTSMPHKCRGGSLDGFHRSQPLDSVASTALLSVAVLSFARGCG